MKGVVLKGIQELVEARFGPGAWRKVMHRAGCDEPFFAAGLEYPDELLLALVGAASEETGLSSDDVLVEFGKFWLPNTGKKSYPSFYELAGDTSREFLLHVDRIHHVVTSTLPAASPPRFEYEDLPDGRLRIHYHSKRQLCPVLRGMILGVGELFEETLEVEEPACVRRGDDHCILEVKFP